MMLHFQLVVFQLVLLCSIVSETELPSGAAPAGDTVKPGHTHLSCPTSPSPSCRPLLGLTSKFRWLVVMVTAESEGYLHCFCFHL